MVVATELGDVRRFDSPRQLMAYLGLVPGEHSSGERRRLGAITKAGNTRVRHILIQAAWSYRRRPTVGAALRRRQKTNLPT
jgi:transposase